MSKRKLATIFDFFFFWGGRGAKQSKDGDDGEQGWRQAPYDRGPWTPERFETLVLRGPNQF